MRRQNPTSASVELVTSDSEHRCLAGSPLRKSPYVCPGRTYVIIASEMLSLPCLASLSEML
jgi:hypothetical protein